MNTIMNVHVEEHLFFNVLACMYEVHVCKCALSLCKVSQQNLQVQFYRVFTDNMHSNASSLSNKHNEQKKFTMFTKQKHQLRAQPCICSLLGRLYECKAVHAILSYSRTQSIQSLAPLQDVVPVGDNPAYQLVILNEQHRNANVHSATQYENVLEVYKENEGGSNEHDYEN